MIEFNPSLSSAIFGNKFLAITAKHIAPKSPEESFSAVTLAQEIGLEKPVVLLSSFGRLLQAGLIEREQPSSSTLLRVESELWRPVGELAELVMASAQIARPDVD